MLHLLEADVNRYPFHRMVAVYQHSCAHKVARQLQRRSQTFQAMAFDIWAQYTQQCHNMRVRMQQMAAKAAYAKVAKAFAGWAQWAAASAGADKWCKLVG